MFKQISISTKITGLVISIVLVTLLAISYISYRQSKEAVQQRYSESLRVVSESKASKLKTSFDHVIASLKFMQQAKDLKEGITASSSTSNSGGSGMDFDFGGGDEDDPFAAEEEETDPFASFDEPAEDDPFGGGFEDFGASTPAPATPTYDVQAFLNDIKTSYNYKNILITGPGGKIKYSTNSALSAGSNFIDPDGSTLSKSVQGVYFSNIIEVDGTFSFYAGAPISHDNGESSIILIELPMAEVYDIIADTTGLGKNGEVILAKLDSSNGRINYINKPRNDPEGAFKIVNLGDTKSKAVQKAVTGFTGLGANTDYRGKENLAYWTYIPNVQWGFVSKIDTEEIFANAENQSWKFLVAGLIILALATIVSLIFSKYLTSPLLSLKKTLELVGNGILPEKVETKTSDEIGEMTGSVNHLVDTLKNTAQFAQQIGEGNFSADFKSINDDDALGMALINMRNNLIEGEKRDKERNWIVTGVAEIGEILRAHDELEPLGDAVVKYIIGKINAVQGAFYVVNDEDEDSYLEMKASFAYNRKKHLKASFKFAEGLVGQSAAERDTVLRTEIPHDYVTITSGILGDQRPTSILIVPLITDEKVYGAVEFAGFEKFDSSKVKFVEELSLILARTVFNIKVNERTRRLLEESQAMSSELQEKQEILRQNAEEMQATQEELQKSNSKLEEQIEEVNRTQNRMQLLLENASEVITIYEEDETVRYISPSVEPILGYTQKEMIGQKDSDKVNAEHVAEFKGMFKRLLENPDEQVTIQYEYLTREGNYIWIESTGTNFMSNPAIHGLIVNSRDITERRRAEVEQRMRSKMQALSENSLDLITRLEDESISYINPVIEEYTGKNPGKFLNQKIVEADLDKNILDRWLEIVEQVNNTNEKVATEMDFPSEMGDRVMQINAIPEFDDNEKLESVLLVSHDITERKIIELEIQNKNKKIADSINYAKRIQNAILPNNTVITKVLPDSFILYKPKDVVSGDFPWYVKIGDEIYLAAVDCTGHGVPGALLSLIGYFLLNDIVRSRKISDPGLILDQLDEGVTTTLRQDQDDSKTKDGMDIALCKINTKKHRVEYAGAHRPLYVMKNGEMEEIKGNKFAIGGGIYKNQTNFTNHIVELKEGDSFYFCSDGFPDQFGGPDNRKYGPKRLRETIVDIHKKSMFEAHDVFDKGWEDWKGEEKQTDDVLLIGIKF
ncbi:PAS domain S-box protein [Fulvivirga sp.]|uniref:PAS domain S-box protein n=1 Tax=Fulvivirga sp. TaxID=1931237 RepID=UPI0032EF920F